MKTSRKKQLLGEFVRHARARITPQMAGLSGGQRRRTPGLRREEVALLCDISVTWYTWIEQGRDVAVSAHVWSKLADVLHLNKVERAYLFELADVIDPDVAKSQYGSLPSHLAECVNAVNGPCYILDKYWNILYFNPQLDQLFDGCLSQVEQANLLVFIFQEPKAKSIVLNWEERAKRAVSEFRADIVASIEEPEVVRFIDDLSQKSETFKYWWDRQTVLAREGGLREFMHPVLGYQEYEQLTFRLATHLEYKLVMLLPH
ncbi:helix-turn-helix transcriptional regulator [Pelistega ratti]|uniref:helix-turn-helix transcriptional regulator n=1 Tax=Pelistega ratti TaxID=2652177 RepID=UPI00135B673C|nr:helix-turn-helix transcriptional regulator [Pelistega ratti]